ncbi:hypothetical protein H4S08_002193 [Coemansia sp. RSA 1365]|nr:hypothetical protein H4S08_002193 [Coemansia sp. RSA 1365]
MTLLSSGFNDSVESTPARPHNDVKPAIVVLQKLKAQGRYIKNAEQLENMRSEYDQYMASTNMLFDNIVNTMPGFLKGGFRNTKTGKKTPGSENNLIALFNLAVNNMTCAKFDEYPLAQPATIYKYKDHQSIPIKGTDMKPDGVFYYSNARKSAQSIHFIVKAKIGSYTNELPSITLGQMAEYAGLVQLACIPHLVIWRNPSHPDLPTTDSEEIDAGSLCMTSLFQ